MTQKEALKNLAMLKGINQTEWIDLTRKLIKFYKCHQCSEPSCCTIACQLTDSEFIDLAILHEMDNYTFFKTYCQESPLGVYLKNPCPFLEKNKHKSRCKIHPLRPSLCRTYPFSSFPGLLINVDICPLSQDIARDLDRIKGVMKREKPEPELTELSRVEKMFNKLDEVAPPSGIEGNHMNILTGIPIYRKLLQEKIDNDRKGKES